MKILIVDDNPEMLLLLRMLIEEKTSYDAIFTNNPFEAARLIKEEDVDSVITEFRTPGLDGNCLLDIVKDKDRDIPVIIISDYGDVETAREAMRKGAFDFIIKPFRQERILFAINNALGCRSLNKENTALKKQLEALRKQINSAAPETVPHGAHNS